LEALKDWQGAEEATFQAIKGRNLVKGEENRDSIPEDVSKPSDM
jgi:hypothetical protein